MPIQTWGVFAGGLCGVALATTLLLPTGASAWGGQPLNLALPADAEVQLASIPQPPDPPRLPPELVERFPELVATEEEEEIEILPEEPVAVSPEAPAVETSPPATPELVFEDPIFEDPRADTLVALPAPPYPVVINAQVEALMDYFSARERERFGMWIARSGRYLTMIRRVFRERGLPEELAYTAMIESGFSPRAVSRVGAKGMWQFMEATGRRYGLKVDRWVDERFDPLKATVAAAQYLGDLYGMFGHWFLAQAAYNAGEARVAKAIQRAKTSDFWALTQTRHLPNETKRFVPQILAATVINRAPARYGFDVTMEQPLEYEEVTIKRPLDFETLAGLGAMTVDDLRDLNPALRAGITPPFGSYVLRVPVGSAARLEAAIRSAPAGKLVSWGLHRVGKQETLVGIARLYQIAPQRLSEVNGLVNGRLRGVSDLIVPVSSKLSVAPATAVVAEKPVLKRPVKRTAARAADRDDRSPVRIR
jgi:membrane-bound lytic murein transglycosylase D